jgi:hypothetical protein
MLKQLQEAQHNGREPNERRQPDPALGRHVMQALGQPGDFYGVQVRELWEGHYRVNVLVGPDAASVKVAHSYFLVADGGGNVASSSPKITRQY